MSSTDQSIQNTVSSVPSLKEVKFPTYQETLGLPRTRINLTNEALVEGLYPVQACKDYYAPIRAENPALWVFGLRYLGKLSPVLAKAIFESQNGGFTAQQTQELGVTHAYACLLKKVGHDDAYQGFINSVLNLDLSKEDFETLALQFSSSDERNVRVDLLQKSYDLGNTPQTSTLMMNTLRQDPENEKLISFSGHYSDHYMNRLDRKHLVALLLDRGLVEEAKDQVRYFYGSRDMSLYDRFVLHLADSVYNPDGSKPLTSFDLATRLLARATTLFEALESGEAPEQVLKRVGADTPDGFKRLGQEVRIALREDFYSFASLASEFVAWSQLVSAGIVPFGIVKPLFFDNLNRIIDALPEIAKLREERCVNIPKQFRRELLFHAAGLYPEELYSLAKPSAFSIADNDRDREQRLFLLCKYASLDFMERELPKELKTLHDKKLVMQYALAEIRLSSGLDSRSLGLRVPSEKLINIIAREDIGYVNSCLYSLLTKKISHRSSEQWKFIHPLLKAISANVSTDFSQMNVRHAYQLMAAVVCRWPQYRTRFVKHYQNITSLNQTLDNRINAILGTGDLEYIDGLLRKQSKQYETKFLSY